MLSARSASTKMIDRSSCSETSVNFGIAISVRASAATNSHQSQDGGVAASAANSRAIRDRSEIAR